MRPKCCPAAKNGRLGSRAATWEAAGYIIKLATALAVPPHPVKLHCVLPQSGKNTVFTLTFTTVFYRSGPVAVRDMYPTLESLSLSLFLVLDHCHDIKKNYDHKPSHYSPTKCPLYIKRRLYAHEILNIHTHGKWSCLPCWKCNMDVNEWSKVTIVTNVTHVSNPMIKIWFGRTYHA